MLIMNASQELNALKAEIADRFARREQLKQTIAATRDPAQRRALWQTLENEDAALSALDTRFKRLWEAQSP